jgi:hypothetical protein
MFWTNYIPLKRWELLTLWHSVSCQKTSIFSTNTVTTLNLTKLMNSPKQMGLCIGHYVTYLQFVILVASHHNATNLMAYPTHTIQSFRENLGCTISNWRHQLPHRSLSANTILSPISWSSDPPPRAQHLCPVPPWQLRIKHYCLPHTYPVLNLQIFQLKLPRLDSANQTCDSLEHYSWEVIDHLPQSPKLMPCNFLPFGPLKSTWLSSDLQQTVMWSKL